MENGKTNPDPTPNARSNTACSPSNVLLLPAEGKVDLLMRDLVGGSKGNPKKTTDAETIMGLEESTGEYIFVDHQQSPDPSTFNVAGGGSLEATNPLLNGKNGDNTYVLRANANIIISAGNWTIGFGSDDGGTLKIPGVNFSWRKNNGSPASDEVRRDLARHPQKASHRGHVWTWDFVHDWTVKGGVGGPARGAGLHPLGQWARVRGPQAGGLARRAGHQDPLHRTGQPLAERLCGELPRQVPAGVPCP